jgi:hypothetical protein
VKSREARTRGEKSNLASRGFGKKRGKARRLNSRRRERRKALVLSLAGSRKEGTDERGAITISRSQVSHGIGGGRLGVSTHELTKSRTAKKNLWIDLKGDSSRESERADLAQGHIE